MKASCELERVVVCCILIALTGAVLAGCGGGVGTSSSGASTGSQLLSASDLYQLGELSRRNGDSASALANYELLLRQYPASDLADDARVGMGDAYLAQGEYELARASYQAAAAVPGADRAAAARLAVATAYVREFESLDGGVPGFVDELAAGEFLANAEAIEALTALASEVAFPAALRLHAQLELGKAHARARDYSKARAAFTNVALDNTDPEHVLQARLQLGLLCIEEGDAAGAIREFELAGATPPGARAKSPALPPVGVLGEFASPTPGFISIDDLTIVVRSAIENSTGAASLRLQAELGTALAVGFVQRELALSESLLEALLLKRPAAPVGDLARFQLGEVRRLRSDPDGAVREYEALLQEFPGSTLAPRASQRLGEILFALFSEAASSGRRVDGALYSNLTATLRSAVGTGPQPPRDWRSSALGLLGRLHSEGIPVPLTIAEPAGLKSAVVGVAHRQVLAAYGAQGTLQWSLETGSRLPDGLTLSADGVLSGKPREAGRFVVTLRVTDPAAGTGGGGEFHADVSSFPLTVVPLRMVSAPRLSDAVRGQPYSSMLVAEGQGPFLFEVVSVRHLVANQPAQTLSGFVPGLSLAADGTISGTPTEASGADPFLISLRVRDSSGHATAAFLSLFVLETGGFAPGVSSRESTADAGESAFPATSGAELASSRPSPAPAAGSVAPRVVTTLPAVIQGFVLTPDGRRALAISGTFNNVLTVVDLQESTVRALAFPIPPGVPVFARSIAVSPDGTMAAVGIYSPESGQLYLIDLQQLRLVRALDSGALTRAVGFTADGRRAVARSASRLLSVDLASGTTRTVDISAVGDGHCLALADDSRRAFVASMFTGLAAMVDLDTGSSTTFALPGPARFADVLPGGNEVVVLEEGGNRVFLVDLRSGGVESLFVGEGSSNLAVSSDGARAVVFAVASSELSVVDLASRRVTRVRLPFPAQSQYAHAPIALSRDGRLALAVDYPKFTNSAALLDLDSGDLRLVPGFGGGSGNEIFRTWAAFSPDGRRAYTLAGTLLAPTLLELSVEAAPVALGLRRRALPAAAKGTPYLATLQPQGGSPDYSFDPAGPLAAVPGLVLGTNGSLSGTPAEDGLYSLEGRIRDSAQLTATFAAPLLVRDPAQPAQPLTLVTRHLPDASAGRGYARWLAAIGGTPPYQFSLAAGSLPTGITLSAEGMVAGTVTRVTTAVFGVLVADARQQTASTTLTLQVLRRLPFLPAQDYNLPASAADVVALDLNRDGRDDLAVGHGSATTNVSLMLSGATGAPGLPVVLAVRDPGQPGTAAAGSVRELIRADFDGNGIADLAVRVSPGLGNGTPPFARPAVVPLLGDGQGGLVAAPAPNVPLSFVTMAAGDLDRDGKDDLAIAYIVNNPVAKATTFLLRAGDDGSFSETGRAVTTNPLQVMQRLAIGDLTGDGHPDLAALVFTSATAPLSLRIYPGRSDGTADFASPSIEALTSTTYSAFPPQLLLTDLNRDGRLDLVAETESGLLRVMLARASGGFGPSTGYAIGASAGRPVAVDLNGDGLPELIVPVPGTAASGGAPGAVLLLFNTGDGTFDAPVPVSAGNAPLAVTAADFNGDGVPDLAVVDSVEPKLRILLGDAAQPLALATAESRPQSSSR